MIKNGLITEIDLGPGNDHFAGGSREEIVHDGNGSDTVALGGGDDEYVASGATNADGNDVIYGGLGTDLYSAGPSSTHQLLINLGNVDRTWEAWSFLPTARRATVSAAA